MNMREAEKWAKSNNYYCVWDTAKQKWKRCRNNVEGKRLDLNRAICEMEKVKSKKLEKKIEEDILALYNKGMDSQSAPRNKRLI